MPQHNNDAREARQEHMAFKEKVKTSRVIDIKEARLDKCHKKIIFHTFYGELLKATGKTSDLGLHYSLKNITEIAREAPTQDAYNIIEYLDKSIYILTTIKGIFEKERGKDK